MYVPKFYQEERRDVLHELMQQYPFATVVTVERGVPHATHMPVLLDKERGPFGTLISHVARANPQWRQFAAAHQFHGQSDTETVVIFQGPHAYISPSWYAGEFNVPTWNYAVVHAYGQPRIVTEPAQAQQMLDDLVARFEAGMPQPWSIPWTDARYEHLTKALVCFEMEITRLEGKLKLSQNKSTADQQGVVAALRASDFESERAVATLMDQNITHINCT